MKKAAVVWLIFAIAVLVTAGMAGDSIFDSAKMNFSFRVFSDYTVAFVMLITSGICWNEYKGR